MGVRDLKKERAKVLRQVAQRQRWLQSVKSEVGSQNKQGSGRMLRQRRMSTSFGGVTSPKGSGDWKKAIPKVFQAARLKSIVHGTGAWSSALMRKQHGSKNMGSIPDLPFIDPDEPARIPVPLHIKRCETGVSDGLHAALNQGERLTDGTPHHSPSTACDVAGRKNVWAAGSSTSGPSTDSLLLFELQAMRHDMAVMSRKMSALEARERPRGESDTEDGGGGRAHGPSKDRVTPVVDAPGPVEVPLVRPTTVLECI